MKCKKMRMMLTKWIRTEDKLPRTMNMTYSLPLSSKPISIQNTSAFSFLLLQTPFFFIFLYLIWYFWYFWNYKLDLILRFLKTYKGFVRAYMSLWYALTTTNNNTWTFCDLWNFKKFINWEPDLNLNLTWIND